MNNLSASPPVSMIFIIAVKWCFSCICVSASQAQGLCVSAGSAWRSPVALHPAWLSSLWALGPRCRAWTWSWWAVATACRWSRRDSPQVTLNTHTWTYDIILLLHCMRIYPPLYTPPNINLKRK